MSRGRGPLAACRVELRVRGRPVMAWKWAARGVSVVALSCAAALSAAAQWIPNPNRPSTNAADGRSCRRRTFEGAGGGAVLGTLVGLLIRPYSMLNNEFHAGPASARTVLMLAGVGAGLGALVGGNTGGCGQRTPPARPPADSARRDTARTGTVRTGTVRTGGAPDRHETLRVPPPSRTASETPWHITPGEADFWP